MIFLLLARAGSQAQLQRQRGERVLSFQMSPLPSRLKHMAAVGGLESAKGKLSTRARNLRPDLLLARAASQAQLQRQRGERVLSFQMSRLPSKSKHMAAVGDLVSAKAEIEH